MIDHIQVIQILIQIKELLKLLNIKVIQMETKVEDVVQIGSDNQQNGGNKFAKMSNFDLQLQFNKQLIEGNNEEKSKILRNRILKFFHYGAKINLKDGYFRPRIQPNYNDPTLKILNNQLIVYGVDFLPTRKIRQMFEKQNLLDVHWINDSNCRIVFEDHSSARDGICCNLKCKDDLKLKMQIQMGDDDVPKGWLELKPYYELSFERNLFTRYATDKDVNLLREKQDYYITYEKAKKEFQKADHQERERSRENLRYRNNRPRNHQYNNQGRTSQYNQPRSSYHRHNNFEEDTQSLSLSMNNVEVNGMILPNGNELNLSFQNINDSKNDFNDPVPVRGISLDVKDQPSDSRRTPRMSMEEQSEIRDSQPRLLQTRERNRESAAKPFKDFSYQKYIKQMDKNNQSSSAVNIIVIEDD